MAVRGVRGAITVEEDSKEAILAASARLMREVVEQNGIETAEICSIQFSMTPDLRAEFPAVAARSLGYTSTPLFCCQEMDIEGALTQCIRVLILFNTDAAQDSVTPVYLERAVALRPDLADR